MAVDISSWPTKVDVCQTLSLSLSQVNNLIKQKRLEVRREKRVGAPPWAEINPKDVAREKELREARDTQAHVMPDGAVIPTPASNPMLPSFEPAEFAELIGAAIAKGLAPMLAALPAPTEQRPEPLLTTKEAAAISSPAWLRARIKSGELKRVGRKISRAALIRLRDA